LAQILFTAVGEGFRLLLGVKKTKPTGGT